jgi:hypothetical protein
MRNGFAHCSSNEWLAPCLPQDLDAEVFGDAAYTLGVGQRGAEHPHTLRATQIYRHGRRVGGGAPTWQRATRLISRIFAEPMPYPCA